MRRWIRKWLGLDKLERRIELLERGVWGREKQLAKELAASRAERIMRPRDARKYDDIRRLRSDNKSVPSGWILLDGDSVVLVNQVPGETASGSVEFTRAEFHRLIDWYNRSQKVRDQ